MAAIAPLSGSASTSAGSGISDAPPNHAVAVVPKPNPADTAGFTAFPNSYAGFGENGSAFGTISVVGGKLAVVSSDARAPQPQTPPAAPSPAPDLHAVPTVAAQARPDGTAATSQPAGQSQSDPTQGLLGAPPTNPIVIQAEDQERAAAAAAAVETNQAAAVQQADHIALQQINARIAAARAAGDAAAVAQLQPRQAAVAGDLQGQTFAGVGSTPPKPFARPEIPTVFLNIAS